MFGAGQLRSVAGRINNVILQTGVSVIGRLDPMLRKVYRPAELATNGRHRTPDEAIHSRSRGQGKPENFGARRILGLLTHSQVGLLRRTLHPDLGNKAIAEWLPVVRLDPRMPKGGRT